MTNNFRKLLASLACLASTFSAPAFATLVVFDHNLMSLQGSAKMVGSDLQLNWGTGEVSSAWLLKPISTANSFSAQFSFSMRGHDNGFAPKGDGFAFALQGWSNAALGRGGGDVGYGGLFGGAVGSVIQTWDNCRIGLDTTGNPYNAPKSPVRGDGCIAIQRGLQNLHYDATAHMLSLSGLFHFYDDDDGYDISLTQSVYVDLAARYGRYLYAGFTGGTGIVQADQRIHSFRFTVDTPDPVPDPEPDPTPVPVPVPSLVSEPSPLALLAMGLGLLGFVSRRRTVRQV
jgi:Bacterial lectin